MLGADGQGSCVPLRMRRCACQAQRPAETTAPVPVKCAAPADQPSRRRLAARAWLVCEVKIAIGGSRRLPRGVAPRLLLNFLLALPDDATILLRASAYGTRGHFERDVEAVSTVLGLRVETRKPRLLERTGRASVYVRDIDLAEEADLVVLFFSPADAESGYSGTFHLFEKALDGFRAVYAWVVYDDGTTTLFGDYDPADTYAAYFQ